MSNVAYFLIYTSRGDSDSGDTEYETQKFVSLDENYPPPLYSFFSNNFFQEIPIIFNK